MKKLIKVYAFVILQIFLVVSDAITFIYKPIHPYPLLECDNGAFPDLIGFPFIYRTSVPLVNSFCGVIYTSGLIADYLVWLIVILLFYFLTKRIKPLRGLNSKAVLFIKGAILFLMSGYVFMLSWVDWTFQFQNDWNLKCFERTLSSFNFFLSGSI